MRRLILAALFISALAASVPYARAQAVGRGEISRPMTAATFAVVQGIVGTHGNELLRRHPGLSLLAKAQPSPALLQALGQFNAVLEARRETLAADPVERLSAAYAESAPAALAEIELRQLRALEAAGEAPEALAALRAQAQGLQLYSLYGDEAEGAAKAAGARLRSARTMAEARRMAGVSAIESSEPTAGPIARRTSKLKPSSPRPAPSHPLIDERVANVDIMGPPRERIAAVSNFAQMMLTVLLPSRMKPRLDATRQGAVQALQDPAFRSRVGTILALSLAWNNPGDATSAEKLAARLERAARTKSLAYAMDPTSDGALAWAFKADLARTMGYDLGFSADSKMMRELPPVALAGVLLHELVHSEFELGEFSAHLIERAYFLWLARRLPADAVREYRQAGYFLHDDSGPIIDRIVMFYSDEKLNDKPHERRELLKRELRLARLQRSNLLRLTGHFTHKNALAALAEREREPWLTANIANREERRAILALLEQDTAAVEKALPDRREKVDADIAEHRRRLAEWRAHPELHLQPRPPKPRPGDPIP